MLKAALIIDSRKIKRWQRDALVAASDLIDIRIVLSCKNTSTKKRLGKNFLYYVLNIISLRSIQTHPVVLECEGARLVEFDSIYEGVWQKIPSSISSELIELDVDVVIKFGMSLLKIDKILEKFQIFSFHHGDPSLYRGRPAGFYELMEKSGSVGVIVQELSNRIDAGRVWAMGHSKVQHHSYKKTATNFYIVSQFILRKALINLVNGTPINVPSEGINYRLPSNGLVLKFFGIISLRKLRRLLYGVFCEKKWNIAIGRDVEILGNSILSLKNFKKATINFGHNFYADPFFSVAGDKIRLEALSSKSGFGEILEINAESLGDKDVLLRGDHYSYPFSFSYRSEEYLVPEVASHSSPYILRSPFLSSNKIFLKGMEKFRVVDSTILEHEGIIYLFCGMNSSAADCLYLFYADCLDKEFVPHPFNPIVIDPSRARMGGRVVHLNGRIYRFGQDNSFGYGDGITVCEVIHLSTTDYKERVVGSLRLEDASGPHTIDLIGNKFVFDFYVDKLSLFAWYRRVAPYLFRRLKKMLG